jgi:hypothetical protein
MELWQMDVMGRVHLVDGSELKVVTGIDDCSRFIVSAALVARATARPVCDALSGALRRHGVPEQILTDNGKVFTARFGRGTGRGTGEVLFDRICRENGIRHLLTAPRSPTTTGKIERLHKTMRAEFFTGHDRQFATIGALQEALDAWVVEYNTERPHQSIGNRPPVERFELAQRRLAAVEHDNVDNVEDAVGDGAQQVTKPLQGRANERPPGVSRWVDRNGGISVAGFRYPVGVVFAGDAVDVVVREGLVEVWHAGVLVAAHAQRARADQADRLDRSPTRRRARDATVGLTVTRLVDSNGSVSFAGTLYRVGRSWAKEAVEVSIVAGSVQIAQHDKVIRVHPVRHDRSRELGAFANPTGRPRRTTAS